MSAAGTTAPRGDVSFERIRSDGKVVPIRPPAVLLPTDPSPVLALFEIVRHGLPRKGLPPEVNDWRTRNFRFLLRSLWRPLAAKRLGLPVLHGALYLSKVRPDGEEVPYGLAGLRVVTTAGVNFLVDAFQGITEPEILKFHGVGTGTNAEAIGDTALQTELTTQYNPDNTRATGTLTEGATANVFRTVGVNAFDGAVAATEHGIFSQAATGGGTLWDRTVFAVQNFVSGESQSAQYDLSILAGS